MPSGGSSAPCSSASTSWWTPTAPAATAPNPRRYLSVNSRSNVFEPFFTSRLVTTTTPFNTRTQHGFVADVSAADVDAVRTSVVRGLLIHYFAFGLKAKGLEYEAGTEIDFTLEGDAHRYVYDGWSIPEPEGTWTDGDVARAASRPPELRT